jgi:hypothetical protein
MVFAQLNDIPHEREVGTAYREKHPAMASVRVSVVLICIT